MNQVALDSLALHVEAEQIAGLYQPPAHPGRPSTLLDAHKVKRFLAYLIDGNYRETACKASGLSTSTLHRLLKLAEAGNAGAIAFRDTLEKAEARAESATVRNVRKASRFPQFWAAGMTYLERKSPEKWGRRPEDSSAPKVIVQVGGNASDVKVLIQSGPSPVADSLSALSPDLAIPVTLGAPQGEGHANVAPSLQMGPITQIMVTSHDHVPGAHDAAVHPADGARFAEGGPVAQGAPPRPEFSPVKASRRQAVPVKASPVKVRRRKPRSRGGLSGLASRLAADARAKEKRGGDAGA